MSEYYPDPYTYYATSAAISIGIWIVVMMIILGIGFACAYFVYQDARRTKRMPTIEWAVIAFLLPVLGMLIYFVVKDSKIMK